MRARWIDNTIPDSNSMVTCTVRDLLDGGMCLFDPCDPYPIWKEEHRAELEKKIIEHYMFRQIGFETPARFKFEINKRMREIMPYYVDIWKTTQYKYNPIENYNMKEGTEDVTEGKGKGKSTDKGNNLSKYSDTPQGSVDRLDDYLTNATKEERTGEQNSESESKHTLKHTAWRTGNIGVTTSQQMIEQERNITINIDMMIIDDLQPLFLGVY